ncbi:MAG: sugar phosphate isomerase/epimerase family protein [Acidobacteriaceae bacterium]
MNSRRDFLKAGSAALVYGSTLFRNSTLNAEDKTKYLNLPLGIQLYSVRKQLPTDYEGTLKQIAAIGYKQVEAAGFFNHSASQVKQAMREAGLNCVSAHYSSDLLHTQFDQIVAFIKEIGAKYIICSYPGHHGGHGPMFTLAEWRWNAEQFNQIGKKIHAAGLKFGYHNHTMEFHKENGVTPYDELMRLTDPAYVTMEMDLGWVVVGGGNPVELLHRYSTRISMLHVKDFKPFTIPQTIENPPTATALGQGSIDYRPIFAAAAATGHIRHCFVEQEEYNMPVMQELTIDANFMRKLHA